MRERFAVAGTKGRTTAAGERRGDEWVTDEFTRSRPVNERLAVMRDGLSRSSKGIFGLTKLTDTYACTTNSPERYKIKEAPGEKLLRYPQKWFG